MKFKSKKTESEKLLRAELSEAQKKNLLKIEARACWVAFGALLLAIGLQMFFGIHSWRELIGETVVFLILDVYIITECIKFGVWDKTLKPNLKTNAIISFMISSAACLLFFFVGLKSGVEKYKALGNALIVFVIIFVALALGLTIASFYHKKKMEGLEAAANDLANVNAEESAATEPAAETSQAPADGRKIVSYDPDTGAPIYAEEAPAEVSEPEPLAEEVKAEVPAAEAPQEEAAVEASEPAPEEKKE